MKKFLVCLLAAAMLLGASALAEVTVESTVLERSAYISTETNVYYMRVDGGYQLFDAMGNALTGVYSDLTAKSYGDYYTFPGAGLNYMGVLDSQGRVIVEPSYGAFYTYNDGWAMGHVIEPVEGDTGDFKDSNNNWYNTVRTDVFCNGRLLGSLSREEYLPAYTEGVVDGYFFVKQTSSTGFFLDQNFNRYNVAGDFYTSTEFNYDYKTKTVTHTPTQQKAFCAGCTLTEADVSCPVWYDDNTGNLLDLQGNVIKSGLNFDYVYQEDDYLRVRVNGLNGLIDLQGNVVIEPVYAEVPTYYGVFPNGYQAAITPEGHLHYLDKQGNVVAKAEYGLSASDYKGFSFNASFAVVKNLGKCIVITAAQGELPTTYEDYAQPKANHQILVVKKDGLWGAIDMNGNTVLPFVHRAALELSDDSTLSAGQNESRQNLLYRLTYSASSTASWTETKISGEEMDTTPVLADGAWECICGVITNGNFCPECGSKKPEPTAPPAPTAAPAADDGSWDCACGSHNTGKFCPECGSKKPEATPVPDPQCQNCGYKPEGDAPKFCPECGTKF